MDIDGQDDNEDGLEKYDAIDEVGQICLEFNIKT